MSLLSLAKTFSIEQNSFSCDRDDGAPDGPIISRFGIEETHQDSFFGSNLSDSNTFFFFLGSYFFIIQSALLATPNIPLERLSIEPT